jgi:signal recognition particle subunit SRP72
MKQNDFDKALNVMQMLSDQSRVIFEKAYCLYRLNKVKESLQLLKSANSDEVRIQELIAQCHYRLEEYGQAYSVYLNLMKNTMDDYGDERETNLAAVMAHLSLQGLLPEAAPELGDNMYELSYNKAVIDIGEGLTLGPENTEGIEKLKSAQEKLIRVEEECTRVLKEEDATEEEIEQELSPIRSQRAFVHQVLKNEAVALSLYNQVLKGKPEDSSLVAVVSNNVVSINKDSNVFDSRKKIKAALTEDAKLTTLQKRAIRLNHALFLMLASQNELCRKQVKELKEDYCSDSDDEVVLLEAALLVKEKKIEDAIRLLQSSSKSSKSLDVSLVLTHLLLSQGRVNDAAEVLSNNLEEESAMSLGIISTLVSLLSYLNETDAVVSTLTRAIKWHQTHGSDSQILSTLYGETSRIMIKNKRSKEAVEMLEQQKKLSKKPDPKVIAQLIAAYGSFDPKKAAEAMKSLPSIDSVVKDVNVEALESSNWSLGAKYVKKVAKTDLSTPKNSDNRDKKKKKRKRKKIMPKRYDPNVDPDPERWLPRWQRSTFKKKKRDKNAPLGRGTQGVAVSDNLEMSSLTKSPRVQTNPTPDSVSFPKGGRGKKKKGGRR